MLPDAVGSLTCWAVDSADGNQQISFNHLYGSATVFDFGQGISHEYSSWNFMARNAALGKPVGTPGMMDLKGSGMGYDACPRYLDFEFGSLGANVSEGLIEYGPTKLALLSCKQDLRAAGRIPTCTMASFRIWNEDLTQYTGARVCLKDTFENYLDAIDAVHGYGGAKFTYAGLKTSMGRVRIEGLSSGLCDAGAGLVDPVCTGNQQASPFVGVAVTYNEFGGMKGVGAITPTGVDAKAGFVKWTPADNDLPVIKIKPGKIRVSEGAPLPGQLTISRTGNTSKTLTVNYTLSGTATNGVDYMMLPGVLTVPAGCSSAVILVEPNDDKLKEDSETLELTLAASPAYQIGAPDSATVTILDND
jgi:hypothetical protein